MDASWVLQSTDISWGPGVYLPPVTPTPQFRALFSEATVTESVPLGAQRVSQFHGPGLHSCPTVFAIGQRVKAVLLSLIYHFFPQDRLYCLSSRGWSWRSLVAASNQSSDRAPATEPSTPCVFSCHFHVAFVRRALRFILFYRREDGNTKRG